MRASPKLEVPPDQSPIFRFLKIGPWRTQSKTESDKGRLRSLMLTSLKRFVSNKRRAKNAQRRKSTAGLMSLDVLMESEEHPFDLCRSDVMPRGRSIK